MGTPGFVLGDDPLRSSQYPGDQEPSLPRRALLSLGFLALYVALDWLTRAFTGWPAARVWYAPAGLAFAFLLTFGTSYVPVYFLAELLTYFLTWKLQVRPLPIFALAAIPPLCYGSAAAVLRRCQWLDLRLRNTSGVAWLLLAGLFAPALAGLAASTWMAANGLVAWPHFSAFLFQRWIGDGLGIVMLTPLLLVYRLPWLKAEVGWQLAGQNLTASTKQHLIHVLTARSAGEAALWAGTTLLALGAAFGITQGGNHHYFYPLFVPMVWIAIRQGLPGAAAGALILNAGSACAFRFFHLSPAELTPCQLFMLALSFMGLLMGVVVTERERTHQQLRLQSAAVESAANAIVIADSKGTLLWVNPAFTRLTGYAAAEVVGQNPRVLKSGRHDAHFYRNLWNTILSGQVWHGEIVNQRKDGSRYTEEMTITPVRDAHGEISHFIGIKQDVTERKQAEEELRQSEERFRLAFEKGPLGVILVGPDLRFLRVNHAMCEMLGYSEQELLALTVPDVTHPEDRGRDRQRAEKILKGEISSQRWEKRYLKKNGETLLVEITATLVRDENGKPLYFLSMVEDITERTLAMEALREANEFNHQMLASVRQGIIVYDRELRYQIWNPFMEELSGVPARKVIGKHALDVLPFLRDLGAYAYLEKALAGEVVAPDDFPCAPPVTTRSGWLCGRYSPLRDASGQIVGVIETLRDVTERRQALDKLRQAEEKYRRIFEDAVVGIFQSTPEGRFLSMNPALARIYGYDSPEEAVAACTDIGRQLYVDPGCREEFRRRLEERGVLYNFESEARTKDGRTLWLLENARAVRDAQGKILYYEGTVENVTEHKQAEAALRKSEARLAEVAELTQTIIASSTVGIATYDAVSGQCVSANEALAKIIGGTTETVLQQNFRQIASWKESGLLNVAEKALSEGRAYRHETRFATTFGKEVWLDSALVPTTIKSRPHLLLMVSDIIEQRRLEEQFRQAQKMEAVGQLAGGIAHDFNNMLGVIIGYCQILQDKFAPGEPAGQQLAEVKKAADRAALLTRQLLAFSRKQVLYPRTLDPSAVVKDLEKMLQYMIGEDIELVIRPGASLGSIIADPSQLEQVLMNLAVNARDAMPRGGQLAIETANVDLDETYADGHQPAVPGPYVMLAVTDTGCGMDAKTKAHIFEPFFTTKEPGKGTGLGLSTVYGVVKQSGGYIWVYSELGRGTTFKIYLPRVDAAPASYRLPPETALPKALASGTILLVEDEEPMRRLASSLLAQAGYTVLEAKSGRDALELAGQHAGGIDLLLTDVVMPGMSGGEAADRLLRMRPRVKVIYMSGYNDDHIAQNGILGPEMVLLEKPFTRESLLSKVREALKEKAEGNAAGAT